MKLANWTKPATGQWPGVIVNDRYVETIVGGSGTGEFDWLTKSATASHHQDCTQDNAFIRVFKIQPSAHKLTIQLHSEVILSTDQQLQLGVFGTIDDVSEDAHWCRVPDTGIAAAVQQHDASSATTADTNFTYNPFGLFTKKTDLTATEGNWHLVACADATDFSATTNDPLFLTASTVGLYGQYCLNVDQLGYDYIAIRITNQTSISGSSQLTTGQLRLIVKQFN